MPVYTSICGDTWMGVYCDDALIYQDHNISYHELFKLVQYEKVEYLGKYECSLDWLESVGCMPERLEDVKISYMGEDLPFYEYLEKSGT